MRAVRHRTKPKLGQGGQSLAEFVLALPVLFVMLFGLLQLGILAVVLMFSHYAASCALRSYTVFYPQGKSLAMQKAGQAMEQAFAWCHPMPDLDLEIKEEKPREGGLENAEYNGRGPLLFNASLTAHVPMLLTFRQRRSVDIHVQSSILSEKTVETD